MSCICTTKNNNGYSEVRRSKRRTRRKTRRRMSVDHTVVWLRKVEDSMRGRSTGEGMFKM